MISLEGPARAIRNSQWLREHQPLRRLSRTVFRNALKLATGNKGLKKQIGVAGKFRLDYAFAFASYDQWGDKHNDGFQAALRICGGKTTVFDIGAHIGLYALPISRVMDSEGTLYAFEPARENLACLEKHIKYNGINNIQVVPYLVGDETREDVDFYESQTRPTE